MQETRICVKNLPTYVKEDRLHQFFSLKGEVTDVVLKRTKDGKSRQFAFVGFRTEEEADETIKYFNRTYFDTRRISCEIAHKVGDPNTPRPWSRHSQKKEGKKAMEDAIGVGSKSFTDKETKDVKNTSNNENVDHQLEEFLCFMQPRAKSKSWANDDLAASKAVQPPKATLQDRQEKKKSGQCEKMVSKKDEPDNMSTQCLASDNAVSDIDYFMSKVNKGLEDSEKESFENDDTHKLDDSSASEGLIGGALDNGRLYIYNLPYTTIEDEIEKHFGKFGNVSGVHIVVDKDTKCSKGIAFVQFTLPESASRALQELDKSNFQGRLLHILPAKQKLPLNGVSPSQGIRTLKQQRQEDRKASEASGDARAWNSLFMRPDTVVENVSRRHGISKSDLLDPEADDLAVRIALGETQVIAETKKALSDAGVNVKSLEENLINKNNAMKRSKNILLVKNLAYGSSESELVNMFGKFGSLDKVILPPTKTLALVIFFDSSAARAAFRNLAYKPYRDVPLYLEWAHEDVFDQSSMPRINEKNTIVEGEHAANEVKFEHNLEGISEMDIDYDRIESRSLFVKNLNFCTSDETLKNHFLEHLKEGQVLSAKIKKHIKNGNNLSMGYGFLEFDSVQTAINACQILQGTVLDGHALKLQLCEVKNNEEASRNLKNGCATKLLVKNVAFQATQKDLRQLFSPFGQIKCLRLPMKFGSHRGFGFVDFVTKQDAQNAFKALSSTHFYGRRLVLERAKESEELGAADTSSRAAAEAQFSHPKRKWPLLDDGGKKLQRLAN